MSGKDVKDTRVLVAMSGGVDSSVTAALLKSQGYQIIGVHLQLSDHQKANEEKFSSRCCSIVDSNDARRVCDRIDAPFYVINAQEVFKHHVMDYFVHEYLKQRTPNPCVECNNKIKFNYLFKKAEELGCDFVATGHYAQVTRDPLTNVCQLRKAVDPHKDQSYFLFGLTQKALQKTMMPLGGLTKMMVRKLAANFDLLNVAEKPDSQEICFIGDDGYKKFVENNTPAAFRPRGPIMSVTGNLLGMHEGLYQFTVGQRKGLQLTGAEAQKEHYVLGFDRDNKALVVGPERYLYHEELLAENINWLIPVDPIKEIHCKAKIRSQHTEAECSVLNYENNIVQVRFKAPQRAITPGQAIVFYDEDRVLGGGFIERVKGSLTSVSTKDREFLEHIENIEARAHVL